MANPLKNKLQPITSLQEVRGVQLPAGLTFIQLVVTGPPGAGKTHYIQTIHGWPNEGYLDLTRKGWWRNRTLTYRPREIHLGLPFAGYTEALTVFDKEWLEAPAPLQLELNRIKIPPSAAHIFQTDWRNRFVFEFLLPSAKTIFRQRQGRSNEGYFPVDEDLTLKVVERQLAIYQQVVLYLHQKKMQVYVREDLEHPPMYIAEQQDIGLPKWLATEAPRPNLATISGWKDLLLRRHPINWVNLDDSWQRMEKQSRIAYDGKPFNLRLGKQILSFYPEIPLEVHRKDLVKSWLITDPATQGSNICGFTRLQPGETIMIGRANKQFKALFAFPKSVGKRHVNITNLRGDLVLTPLDDQLDVEVLRLKDSSRKLRMQERRYTALAQIKKIYGGSIDILPPDKALKLLQDVNTLLENEPYRAKDKSGRAGGLIELPVGHTPIIVGDLHAQVNNLLKIVSENKFLDAIEGESACLIILGDAVHSELPGEMELMDSSILMMDLILSLKKRFPASVFYLRGNHDSFNPDICKEGICQGNLLRRQLMEVRGREYVMAMERLHNLLPYVITGERFIACHAGPPGNKTNREQLINLRFFPEIAKRLTSNRLIRPNYFAGYTKGDVKRFRSNLHLPKKAPFIVGHTPLNSQGSVWLNAGDIKNHHIIYSGRPQGPSMFVEINHHMIPFSYPAEPLINIIGKMR